MEFRKIEYFLKVAETLSFTDAAGQLFISPQALTQQIAALEAELGCKLFARSTRKVSLTPAGELCFLKFAPVKAAFDKAQNEIRQHIERSSHTLRAGFFNALPKQEFVYPWLSMIQAFFPDTELELISTDLGTIWKYLDEGKLDIILTNVDSSFPMKNYDLIAIKTVPAQAVVSLMHPWTMKDRITPDDLENGEILQFKNAYAGDPKKSFYARIPFRSITRVNDFDTMLAMLESGKYYAVFPNTFSYHEQAKFKYFALPEDCAFDFTTVCAARRRSDSKLVRDVMEMLHANY